ncbi:MAG: IS21-like element helper ATPase IstB [Chloroflexi bacterium]|nr:IS21-like element helper ATPase IstB [Chloroflexota bacterium]
MLNQSLFDKLLLLRLPAFREGLREQQANPQYADLAFEERLTLLVDQECTRRSDHRLHRRLILADFPIQATIEEVDFTPERSLDRRLVFELAQGQWIRNSLNLLILGPTGGGKTFLSCALGNAAARSGFSVRFLRTSRLLHALDLSRQDGSYANLLRSLAKVDLLIFDDWMRDSISIANAQDLLEIFDDRFGRSSTLISSQVPVAEWHARLPDPTLADAILDRLIHNAYRLTLQGESQRKLRAIRTMPNT